MRTLYKAAQIVRVNYLVNIMFILSYTKEKTAMYCLEMITVSNFLEQR